MTWLEVLLVLLAFVLGAWCAKKDSQRKIRLLERDYSFMYNLVKAYEKEVMK